jgi:hypothetical protein
MSYYDQSAPPTRDAATQIIFKTYCQPIIWMIYSIHSKYIYYII